MSDRPYHVLISRLSAIGDCVLTLPVATALKKAIPEVRVSWVVSSAGSQLIECCPDVDDVFRISKRWLREPREWRRLRQHFREWPVDAVIDAQSLTKSAMIGLAVGARTRVGFCKPQGREFAPMINTIGVPIRDCHLADGQLRLLTPLGIPAEPAEFRLDLPPSSREWAESQLTQLVGHRSPIIMNPGAGWESRLWPVDRFGRVAAWLQDEYGTPTVVVWGDPQEQRLAEEIAEESGGAAVVAPETDLVQLAAMLKAADSFLSSDTGPMHIAAAVGTRCISMHGPTRPEKSGPYGPQHIRLCNARLKGSSRTRRRADNRAMLAIAVEDVCDAFVELFSRTDNRDAA